MKKQTIGIYMFWIGVFGLVFNYLKQWITNPIFRDNSVEDLIETIWAADGFLFILNGMLTLFGIGFTIIGILLYSANKGSFFWLWGFMPFLAFGFLSFWQPSQHLPPLFGIGGGIVTLSYLGVLWNWIKNHTAYKGKTKTGKHIQLIGFSFLYVTALLLCMYLGTPKLPGMAETPIPSGESIIIAFSIGFLLLYIGHYLTGLQNNEDS